MTQRKGFTLVELLVVIAIIGMLVGLLLPAVQQAREAARRMQCNNQLKQIGLACLNHESANQKLPSGGWTISYVGDPDRGFGKGQPGSWAYSLLPFMEQNALYQQGATGNAATDTKAVGNTIITPVKGFTCPSRRSEKVYDCSSSSYTNCSDTISTAQAKSCYAANFGSTELANSAKNFGYSTSTSKITVPTAPTGVIYDCSETRLGEIRDGTTNTYLIGEKFIYTDKYETSGEGDQVCMYAGLSGTSSNSNYRSAGALSITVTNGTPTTKGTAYLPTQDRASTMASTGTPYYGFGGPHSGGFSMGMCDGSVQSVTYSIDQSVHACLANRRDNAPAKIPD